MWKRTLIANTPATSQNDKILLHWENVSSMNKDISTGNDGRFPLNRFVSLLVKNRWDPRRNRGKIYAQLDQTQDSRMMYAYGYIGQEL